MRTHGGAGMKDLSFFLLKNSLAAKMKKGIRSFCNGVGSTTTLDQRKAGRVDTSCVAAAPPSVAASSSFLDEGINTVAAAGSSPLTLEQMILQLDMEEEAARRAKLDDDDPSCAYSDIHHHHHHHHRRMSCVHSSDILRSARNALNQYPRFSLDGRDAMYRSSFLNAGRRSVRRPAGLRTGAASPSVEEYYYYGRLGGEPRRASTHGLPATVAGETVVWCKPGVVAQLMGLEAVPVPLGGRAQYCGKRRVVPAMGRKQSLRRMGRHELERERLAMGVHGQCRGARRESVGSCSGGTASSCCVAPPPVCARPSRGPPDWRLGRAR